MALTALIFNLTLFSAQEPDDGGELRPKTNAEFYVVRDGDALSLIEERTGVESEQIEALNPKLDPLALLPGQRIRLRPPTGRELAARRARARRRKPRRAVYVLKQGDTLFSVATKNDVDLTTLLRLNPRIKRPDSIYPGQRINLR